MRRALEGPAAIVVALSGLGVAAGAAAGLLEIRDGVQVVDVALGLQVLILAALWRLVRLAAAVGPR